MGVEQLWLALKGRLHIVILSLAVILSITIFLLAITPSTYTARTSLSFEFKGSNPYASVGSSSEGGYIATQLEIINSQAVAERVFNSFTDQELEHVATALLAKKTIVDEAFAKVRAFFRAFGAEEAFDDAAGNTNVSDDERASYRWIIRALPNDLTIKPVIGSRIITLSYTATHPRIATMLANRYADTYIKTNLEMIINPAKRTKAWFDERLKTLRSAVEEAQSELTIYQQEKGILAADDRFDIENQRLMDLTSELSAAQEQRRIIRTKISQVTATLEGGGSLETLPEILDDDVIQTIKADIRNAEAKLIELSAKLGVNHPQYQQTLAEIRSLKEKLKAEILTVVEGLENEGKSAEGRARRVEAALKAQKNLVLQLKDQRGEANVLVGELESAREAYDAALEQYNSANLQSLVTQANVNIVDPASRPFSPSGPKYLQNIVLAIVVGLMLGVGLAFLLEALDRRVRSKDELAHELGIPVLGVVQRV